MKKWERWQGLSTLQKILFLIQIGMIVIFAAAYLIVQRRYGFPYQDTLLYPSEVDGQTIYSGRAAGQQAQFTVSPDGTVAYRWGETSYGPFTVQLDPTAVPPDETADLIGVEVREGDAILFRGGWQDNSSFPVLIWEDGEMEPPFRMIFSDGTAFGLDGQQVDAQKPMVSDLLQITSEPKLTHRGAGQFYFLGTFIAAANLLFLLFAEALFRRNLAWIIRQPEKAEPSEWELFMRKASWIILTFLALIAYMYGLNTIV